VTKKNKQLSAEQKKLQQQLEGRKNAHGTSTVGSGRETKIG
jgi:hypothetical protein